MKFKLVTIVLVTFLLASCKSDKKNGSNQGENEEISNSEEIIKDDTFRVQLKVKVPLEDVFEMYYTDDSPEEIFSGKKKIRKKVQASETFQNIEFALPKEKLPFKFRLDLGENKEQQEIKIDQITLSYNIKEIILANDLIHSFFLANQFLKSDKKGTYKLTPINKKHDPFISAKAILIKKIELEL